MFKTLWIAAVVVIAFALGYGVGRSGPEKRAADADRLIEALHIEIRKAEESIDAKDRQLGELWAGCKGQAPAGQSPSQQKQESPK